MDDPKLVAPTTITACLMPTSLSIAGTGVSQAGITDQNKIGAQALYPLTASEASSNSTFFKYPEEAGGELSPLMVCLHRYQQVPRPHSRPIYLF